MDGTIELVRRWVDERRDALLGELAEWVSRPSVSATGEGMAAAAEYGVELLRGCGLDPAIVPTGGWPALTGTADGPAGAPHVLVYGHYDVQPPGPLEKWHSAPFTPQVREGRMYGRGTGDNKAQHLAQLLALRALREITGGLPCRVTVLLDGEEEIGSPHLAGAVRAQLGRQRPDLVVWSDGPVHDSGQACVALGVRGIVIFELRATGPARPLHSGNWGNIARNPAWRLTQLLATMRDPGGTILVDGFADGVEPLSPGELAALQAMPEPDLSEMAGHLSAGEIDSLSGPGYYQRLTAPTFSINSLSCEDGGEHRTVIPSVAVARCDVRLAGGQRSADVIEALRRHVAEHAPDVELVVKGTMEPSRTLPESPYTAAILAGVTAALGRPPLLTPIMGGSLPIGVFTGELGLPCYGVPLANVDENNHAANENMELDRFTDGIVTAAAVQLSLSRQP